MTKRHSMQPAEDLHNIANETGKKSVDTFVNPGTPDSALVGMDSRKTGKVSGTADSRLRAHMNQGK